MTFKKLQLGTGIYRMSEIAQILRLPYRKVQRWMSTYWKNELDGVYEEKYSFKLEDSKAFTFHAFIEFYVMMELSDAGVKPKQILKAHKELREMFNSDFPFAHKTVLGNIQTDGKTIYFETDKGTVSMDGTKQFNIEYVNVFFKKLDFGDSLIAKQFWPMGKDKSILMNPERMMGHPLIENHNIYPETIYANYKAGDPVSYLAYIYELSEKQIRDAIDFCEAA